jgi:hypothetical protein
MGELGRRRLSGLFTRNEYGEYSKTAIAEPDLDTFFPFSIYIHSRESLNPKFVQGVQRPHARIGETRGGDVKGSEGCVDEACCYAT